MATNSKKLFENVSEAQKLNEAKNSAQKTLSNQYNTKVNNTFSNIKKVPNQMDIIDPGRPGGNGSASFTDLRKKEEDTTPVKTYGIGSVSAYIPTVNPVEFKPSVSAPANPSFTPSESYLKAMESANQILSQLASGKTSYTDKVSNLMDQIAERPAFQYDMNTDTLFQNSLQSAMLNGQTAMQDTMGQAAALTGGYGSTYATSAANQAYNSYIQDAYANLPDYYNMALEAYQMEGQDMYNKLGMYQNADDREYSRLQDAYQNTYNSANDMYSKEYTNYFDTYDRENSNYWNTYDREYDNFWKSYDAEYNNYWQTVNANQNAAQFNAEMAYKQSRDQVEDDKWLSEYEKSLYSGGNNYKATDFTDQLYDLVETYGPNSEGLADGIRKYSEAFDIPESQLIAIANGHSVEPQYSLNSNNLFTDRWKNISSDTVTPIKISKKTDKNEAMYDVGNGVVMTETELKARGIKVPK